MFDTESIRKKRMVRFRMAPGHPPDGAVREWPRGREGILPVPGKRRYAEPKRENPNENISRAAFLRLGVLGIPATALLLAAGCGGEEDDGDDD